MNTIITQIGEDIVLREDGDTVPYIQPYFSRALLINVNQKLNYVPFEVGELTILNNRIKNKLNFDLNDRGELEVLGLDAKRYFINKLIGLDFQTEFNFYSFWKNTQGISGSDPLYNMDTPFNTSCSSNKAGSSISNEGGLFKVNCDNSDLSTISIITLSFIGFNIFSAGKHTIELNVTQQISSQPWIDPILKVVSFDIVEGGETIYEGETYNILTPGIYSFDFEFPANNIIVLRFEAGLFLISSLKITKFSREILLYPEYDEGVLVYDDEGDVESGIGYMEIENNFIID